MYLAIDIGTSSCKGALRSDDSYWVEQIGLQVINSGLCVEQDPSDWLEALKLIIPRLLQRAGRGAAEIQGISVSSHSPSLVPVDEDGVALLPCLTWQDRRAQNQASRLSVLLGEYVDPSHFEAKILWIKENEPHVYARTKAFLQPKDFIISHLTGKFIIDRSAALLIRSQSGSQIDLTKIPDALPNWEIVSVTSQWACHLGLVPGIPVVAGGIDAYCEALGAGLVEDGQFGDVTGTSTCLSYCLDESNLKPGMAAHVIPQRALYILPMSLSGGALTWFMSNLGKGLSFDDIGRVVAQSPPGARGLIFLPYLAGERSPLWDDQAKGVFFGITGSHTQADFLRAVLEGSAFAVRHNLEFLAQQVPTPNEARATGGGARLAIWNQIKADVTGLSYQQLDIAEGALLGGIILAMYAVEKRPISNLVSELVGVQKVFTPQPSSAVYDESFYRFKQLYSSTRELMHRTHS